MTFQRGQGLNHAIQDSYRVCQAIKSFWNDGDFTIEQRSAAVRGYEEEMIPRGGEEVRLSEENSVKMHKWSKAMQSPSLRKGMQVDMKVAKEYYLFLRGLFLKRST